jgi:hypothetical protein
MILFVSFQKQSGLNHHQRHLVPFLLSMFQNAVLIFPFLTFNCESFPQKTHVSGYLHDNLFVDIIFTASGVNNRRGLGGGVR